MTWHVNLHCLQSTSWNAQCPTVFPFSLCAVWPCVGQRTVCRKEWLVPFHDSDLGSSGLAASASGCWAALFSYLGTPLFYFLTDLNKTKICQTFFSQTTNSFFLVTLALLSLVVCFVLSRGWCGGTKGSHCHDREQKGHTVCCSVLHTPLPCPSDEHPSTFPLHLFLTLRCLSVTAVPFSCFLYIVVTLEEFI